MSKNAQQPLTVMPFRALLGFSFTNAMTWMIALGTPMVLLAGELGASTFEVGVAYACVFFLLPIQILATAALPRFGFKRQMIFGWSTRAVFLFVPLGLAWSAPAEPSRSLVYLLVGSVIGFAFFRCIGSCAVMPWIYSLVPDEIRGRYFSTDQSLTGLSGVITLLLCAALFAFLPLYEAFVWQYSFALLGTALSILLLLKVPDAPRPATTSVRAIVAETPGWCLRPGPFRQYLLFILAANLVMTAFPPFIAYFLQVETALSAGRILLYTALQYVGAILGALWLRERIDKVGVKPAFRTALVLFLGLMAYWIALVLGGGAFYYFLPLGYLAFGAATAHWNAANLKYLPRVCPEEKRALAVSIHSSVVGVLGGIAPILWGFLLRREGGEAGVIPSRFVAYLAVAIVVQGSLFFYVGRLLSGDRTIPPVWSNAYLLRSMRYFGSLLDLVPRAKSREPSAEEAGTPEHGA